MSEPRQLVRVDRIHEADPSRLISIHGFDLPQQLTTFVGRRAVLASLESMLHDPGVRLLTLTGPGGVGKTRLALRIAERMTPSFPDGVLFVPLAAVVDPALVMPTLAKAAGVDGDDDRPLLTRLLGRARSTQDADRARQFRAGGFRRTARSSRCCAAVQA